MSSVFPFTRSGFAMGRPASSARRATSEGTARPCRPTGRSGRVTTSATSKPAESSASSDGTANSGVPKKTILKDDGNKIADRLGATRTPEVYLLDAKGKLAYHGRIDNSQKAEGITSNDLREALDQVIAGKAVTKTDGAAFGCTIKRVS